VAERPEEEVLSAAIAAGLAREAAGDPGIFLDLLTRTLEATAPERVSVARGGLFGGRAIRRVEVDLDEYRYRLHVGRGGGLTTERTRIVRGIALKTETLSMADWLQDLSRALVDYGRTHEAALDALKRYTW
jgi:hypothetical protein